MGDSGERRPGPEGDVLRTSSFRGVFHREKPTLREPQILVGQTQTWCEGRMMRRLNTAWEDALPPALAPVPDSYSSEGQRLKDKEDGSNPSLPCDPGHWWDTRVTAFRAAGQRAVLYQRRPPMVVPARGDDVMPEGL